MSRPAGDIRLAIRKSAEELASTQGPFDFEAAARAACVGYRAAHQTIKDMARAGELAKVGKYKPAGSRVWRTLYEPSGNFSTAATSELDQLMRGWTRA